MNLFSRVEAEMIRKKVEVYSVGRWTLEQEKSG